MPKLKESQWIWMNGQLIPWTEAKIHILSHVIHYGSSVFEGIICYKTQGGRLAIFRLKDHVQRLFNSAKIYRMNVPYTEEEISFAIKEIVKINKLEASYIRPIIYRGYGEIGVNPFNCPVEVAIAAIEFVKYLGPEATEQGIDVMVSSWNRMAPNTFPAMAKAGGHYMNSQLIKMEAITYGFAEGIALDPSGYVSEGSGENIFAVKNGKIYTPPLSASILPGITRNTIITLAQEINIEVKEQSITRELLYLADEVFLCGTWAEITPIRSIDKIQIGSGERPITKRLQQAISDVTSGKVEDKHGWLDYID